ncbi:response regulator [Crocosphaera sp.]|uniref:response regulator n=1 Tax=Crocosphaera sp. TaxID=2729996 RepID=UPI003F224975|nr:response regulator [Crocosphaera sp.]
MSSFNYTGQLIITSNDIIWRIDLEQTKIKSASHSLQSIKNLELCLYGLGYGEKIAKIIEKIVKNGLDKKKGNKIIEELMEGLIRQENLSSSQQIDLINELTKDTLESFFSIKTVDHYICEEKKYYFPLKQGFESKYILEYWEEKQKKWQQFNSLILSPHQRIYCSNLQHLNKLISAKFSHLSAKNIQIEEKISIRKLSQLLNLEDWEVATVIYPYLQSGVLQLESPLPPFNKLPPFAPSDSLCHPIQPSNKIIKTQGINNSNKCKKIVCIDDNETTLNTVKAYLNSDETHLYLVSDPKLALNQLFEIKPDLLLVDINLSGINGYQFSKILKTSSVFKHLPIIMMSSDHEKINEVKTKENVANDFLPKPCDETELMTVINKYLWQV